MSDKGPRGFNESYRRITPPKGGGSLGGSQLTPLSRARGMLPFECPVCFLPFLKPAAWTKKHANNYCSRACSAEAQKVRVSVPCSVCNKPMEMTPSNVGKKTTCSRECMRLKRWKRTGGRLASCLEYKDAVRRLMSKGGCACGSSVGPFWAHDIKIDRKDGELPTLDDSAARLLCKRCHFNELSGAAVLSGLFKQYQESRRAEAKPSTPDP